MFKFLFNLFKKKNKYKKPDYEVIQENIGHGTMVRIESNRELTPEEIGKIIAEQMELQIIKREDFEDE